MDSLQVYLNCQSGLPLLLLLTIVPARWFDADFEGGNIQNPSASQCYITEGEKGTHCGPWGPSRDAPALVP